MTLFEITEYCNNKFGATLEYPFDAVTMVFKVFGKMFALVSSSEPPITINVKCDPELAIELREKYDSVTAGYHMNKKHWNTITCDRVLDKKFILTQIDNSYSLVFNSLPKKFRENL